jgi:hypothetical protein
MTKTQLIWEYQEVMEDGWRGFCANKESMVACWREYCYQAFCQGRITEGQLRGWELPWFCV